MGKKVCGLIEISGISDIKPINPTMFKQLSVQENLEIPSAKPDIEQIVSVNVGIKIKNTYVINTPVGFSREGQNLTGHKLVVEGLLIQKVEYVADEPTQSVHAAHFEVPFSTYIVLPLGFVPGTKLDVTGYIEDIYVQLLCKRTIFKNVTILLDARI